jgi:hypothetical protein
MSIVDAENRRIAQRWAEYVEKATALIEEKGWAQGCYEHPVTGAICAEGALMLAVSGTFEPTMSADNLIKALETRVDGAVPDWNDNRCTGPEQALGELRTWAADLRKAAGS